MALSSIGDFFFADDGSENVRNQDRSVGLLIVFQNGENGPADSHGRAVERVDEVGPLLPGNLVADIESAGLIVGAVGSAGDFAVFAPFASTGHPGLEVILAIGGTSQIAGARVDDLIRQAQSLEN